jgi:3-hydroxybutyryl-CoA dehydrogenase
MTERIAIIGAGLMGHGIAQLFAARGHEVALYDIATEPLDKARQAIEAIGVLLGQDRAAVDRVAFLNDLERAVAGADIVIEAAPEKPEMKQDIFRRLDEIAPPEALLASNTSVIPIATIATPVRDKGRVMGTHFWNPPYLVPLVEVIETADTRRAASDRMMALLAAVGQEPVRVLKDIPGFIGNRLQHALKREAIALLAAGVCDAETIDTIVKQGFGRRMAVLGPMEQSDLVGLDLTLDISEALVAHLDRTAGPHPFLRAKVAAGKLGMKSGEGFRRWTPQEAENVRARLRQALVADAKARRQKTPCR